MATTARVTQLSGQAWIRGADGSLTAIHEGSRIPEGAEVVTASGSTVQLQIDGQPPITLGENRQFLFSQDVAQNNIDPSEAAVAAPSDPVVDTLIAALNSGADPFAELDPTAAVLTGGGGEGGASFTRLLSVVESTAPLGLDYPRPTLPGVDDLRLSGFGGEVATDDSGTTVVQPPTDPTDPIDPVVPPLPAPPTVVITDGNSVQAGQQTIAEDAVDPVSGTFTITTPGGLAFVTIGSLTLTAAQVAALGQPGATPVEIDTDKGKLVLTGFNLATGQFSYDYFVDGAQDHSAGDDSVMDAISITVTDGSGQDSSGTLDVLITDSNPAASIDDGGSLTEDAAISVIGGNVLDNDHAVDAPMTLRSWEEVANKEVMDQLALLGTLNLNPDGSWSFELNNTLDAVQALTAGQTQTFTLQYIMQDADGDTANATLSLSIVGTNDAPVIDAQCSVLAVSVSEEGLLPNGRPDAVAGETDTTDSLTASGKVAFSDVDTADGHIVTLAAPPITDVYTSNDSTVQWQLLDGDKTLIGYILEGTVRTDIITVTIGNDGVYTATLSGPIDHPVNPVEDVLGISLGVVVTDAAGATATSTLTISVEDDSPVITPVDPVSVILDGIPDVFTGVVDFTGTEATQNQFSFADGAVLVTGKGFTSATDLTLIDAPLGQTGLGLGVASGASPNHNLANEIDFRITADGQLASEEMTISLTGGKVAYGLSIDFAQMYGGETESGVALFYRGDTLIATIPFTSTIGDGHYAANFEVNEGGFDRVVLQATNNGNGALQDNSDFTITGITFLGSPSPQPIAYATDTLDVAYGADGAGKTGGLVLTGAEGGLATVGGLAVVSTLVGANLIQGHDSEGALVYELHLTQSTGQWELFQYQALAKGSDGMIDFTFKVTDADGDAANGVFQVVPETGPAAPTLSISDVEVIEGIDSHAVFTVGLSHATHQDITFDLALVAGTALTPGDYSGLEVFDGLNWVTADSATIVAGQTAIQVRTAIIDDNVGESAEHFTLEALVTAGTVSNTDAAGTGTILDVYVASLTGNQVVEGGDLTYHVELNNAASVSTEFTLTLGGGSSTAAYGQDFELSGMSFTEGVTFVSTGGTNGGIGTITIPPGVSSFDVIVATLDDSVMEPNETLRLIISGGGGTRSVYGTILDNDQEAVQLNEPAAAQSVDQSYLAPHAGGILDFDDVLGHGDASGGDLLQFLPLAQAEHANGGAGAGRAGGSGGDGDHGNQMVVDQIDMGGDHGQAQMVSQMIEQGKLKVDSGS